MSEPEPMSTAASRVVLRTPFFVIEEDQVRTDASDGTYWVMRRPPFAAAVVRNEAGEILCVRNWRYPIRQHRWELPQGNSDEPDLRDVARTEVLEETGVTVSELELIGRLHEAYGYSDAKCDVYAATMQSQGAAAPEPLEAIDGSRWFSIEQFWSAVKDEKITDAVSIAALAMWQSHSPLEK